MEIVPITFRAACDFVRRLHRHNKPPRGHKYSVGLEVDGVLVGVAMSGRPIARHNDDGRTIEVNRTCTDGTKNANSKLYGAAVRAAKAMGYKKAITYTQGDESGSSLRAAGFVRVRDIPPAPGWDRPSRPRGDADAQPVARVLWECRLA